MYESTIILYFMEYKKMLFIGLGMLCAYTASAREDNKKKTTPSPKTEQIDAQISNLMADRVGFKKDIALDELAAISDKILLDIKKKEALIFPAENLYGENWENKWVDPARTAEVAYPDSCEIDVSSFVMPIDILSHVTSPYGPRWRRMHNGIDLKVYVGDTVRSSFEGKVRIKEYERRGYGHYVVIRHPNGLETIYAHLSKPLVEENTIVRAGDPIGIGGNTGRSTGSHLHFEVRFLGKPINPAELFDFENAVPHKDSYTLRNIKIRGRNSNVYTSYKGQSIIHRVKSGDSLGKIARMYGTSITQLCSINNLKRTSVLRIGQSIRLNLARVSTNRHISNVVNAKGNPSVYKTKPARVYYAHKSSTKGKRGVIHRVRSGDTLGALAARYGVSIKNICDWNGISRSTTLRIGRKLRCS